MPSKHKQPRLCSIEGCSEKHLSNGLCSKHYRKEKARRNPEVYSSIEQKRQDARFARKVMLVREMGGKCSICGYDNINPACYDFHHINPLEKEYWPSKLIRTTNIEKIRKELSKCILVCKNCHADIHHALPINEAP